MPPEVSPVTSASEHTKDVSLTLELSRIGRSRGSDLPSTEALTQEAIKALDRLRNITSRSTYMSHYAIHIPIDKDKRFYQKYIDKGVIG